MEGNRFRTYILKSQKKKKKEAYLTNLEIPISQFKEIIKLWMIWLFHYGNNMTFLIHSYDETYFK